MAVGLAQDRLGLEGNNSPVLSGFLPTFGRVTKVTELAVIL